MKYPLLVMFHQQVKLNLCKYMNDLYEELYWVWEERLQYMVENAGYKPSSKHEELTLEILVLG